MKILNTKKATDNRYLNMFEVTYRDTRGVEKTWTLASRRDTPRCVSKAFDIPDAVVIVPFHLPTGKLVLINEFRVPLGDYQIGFPAGLVDAGETAAAATARELREETGLKVTQVHAIAPPAYTSTGLSDESVAMIHVSCTGAPSKRFTESSEDIETLLVSPTEAGALLDRKDLLIDVKTYLVVSVFAKIGKIII